MNIHHILIIKYNNARRWWWRLGGCWRWSAGWCRTGRQWSQGRLRPNSRWHSLSQYSKWSSVGDVWSDERVWRPGERSDQGVCLPRLQLWLRTKKVTMFLTLLSGTLPVPQIHPCWDEPRWAGLVGDGSNHGSLLSVHNSARPPQLQSWRKESNV